MFDLAWDSPHSVASVRLNRPPANAIGPAEIQELQAVLDKVEAQASARAVIFHSHGRFFSAGADLAFMSAAAETPEGLRRLMALSADMQAAYARIEALPILTIAAISGICVGGGLELALACDFRLAERNATLGLPEAKLGLLPGAGGTQRMTAIVGRALAKRLILTGELVSGDEAYRLGMVHEAVAPGNGLDAATALARSMVATPRVTIAAIKRCLGVAPSEGGYRIEVEESLALHGEPETQSLIAAFLARSHNKKVAV